MIFFTWRIYTVVWVHCSNISQPKNIHLYTSRYHDFLTWNLCNYTPLWFVVFELYLPFWDYTPLWFFFTWSIYTSVRVNANNIFQLNNTYLFVIPFVLIVFNWRIFIFVQVCLNDIFNQKIFFSLQVHIMIFSLVEYSSLFKPMFVMFFDRRIFTSGVLLIFNNLSLISF